MKKKTSKTIGQMAASRYIWMMKPQTKIIPSGKLYNRNKKVKDSENKEQKIHLSSCIQIQGVLYY